MSYINNYSPLRNNSIIRNNPLLPTSQTSRSHEPADKGCRAMPKEDLYVVLGLWRTCSSVREKIPLNFLSVCPSDCFLIPSAGFISTYLSRQADIKKGYKQQALKWHPDKNIGGNGEATAAAVERFKQVPHTHKGVPHTL